jgi:hypothetical protein
MESNSDPGSGTEKSRIREWEKQPGSATLLFCQEYSRPNVPLIVVPIFEGVMCLVSDPWGAPGVRSLLSGKMELPGVFSCECPFNVCHYT